MNNFVKTYHVVNPKRIMINYDLFAYCKNVPVAVENEQNPHAGFYPSVEVPTSEFLPYLRLLSDGPDKVAANPANRTFYVIELKNNEKMYIFPNLKSFKNPFKAFKKNVAFNVTPEINRAIVDVLKTFTR